MDFLRGRISHLILLNYGVEPELLSPYLPPGIEADLFHGCGYLSLVGLRMQDLKLCGLPLPFSRQYAQVNLRCYVRRQLNSTTWRQGVVFIRQVVPHPLLAWAARRLFHEQAMAHRLDCAVTTGEEGWQVEYAWHGNGQRHFLRAALHDQPRFAVPTAERDFFVNRHWGYSAQPGQGLLEYRLDHPPWQAFHSPTAETAAAIGDFYGPPFDNILSRRPDSAFAGHGSPFVLHRGQRL